MRLCEVTDTDQAINPQHLRGDPADIWILIGLTWKSGFRSQITFLNIEKKSFYTIYARSLQHDTATALAEFALSECYCYCPV